MDSMLTFADLREARDVFRRLKTPRDEDGMSRALAPSLSARTTELLAAHQPDQNPAPDLVRSMQADLNAVIRGPSIWRRDLFTDVVLSPRTKRAHRQYLTRFGQDARALNRCLLEDAYPTRIHNSLIRKDGINRAVSSWSEELVLLVEEVRTNRKLDNRLREHHLSMFATLKEAGMIALLRKIEKEAAALADAPDAPEDPAVPNPARDEYVKDLRAALNLAGTLARAIEVENRKIKTQGTADLWLRRVVRDMAYALEPFYALTPLDPDALM